MHLKEALFFFLLNKGRCPLLQQRAKPHCHSHQLGCLAMDFIMSAPILLSHGPLLPPPNQPNAPEKIYSDSIRFVDLQRLHCTCTDTHAICYKKPATNLSSDQMGTMIFTQKREGFALLVTCDRRQGRIRLTRGKLGQTGHETRPFSPPSSPPTRELSVPHARAARPWTWAPR